MRRCAALVPHECIHGRSKQPELHYNANANQNQQRRKQALCLEPGGCSCDLHSHGKYFISLLFQLDSRQRT